jgi:5-methyltetrahydrofolate--homocysteine methyltransferase
MRQLWGVSNEKTEMGKGELQRNYQGMRISPGYALCPDLSTQKQLFRMLSPEEIGIELTDSMMMDPEASVSAIVFSHPEAKIFSV